MLNIDDKLRSDISDTLNPLLESRKEEDKRIFRRDIREALKQVSAEYSSHAEQGEKISRKITDAGIEYMLETGWKMGNNKRQKYLVYKGKL